MAWPNKNDKQPDDDIELQVEQESGEAVAPVPKKPPRPNAMAAILDAAFDAATTPQQRRQLHSAKAVAVIVTVPTASWVVPVDEWFARTFGGRWTRVVHDAARTSKLAAVGEFEAPRALARGLCVVGISSNAGSLPSTLVNAADMRVVVAAPTPDILRAAVARFTRRPPPADFPAGAGVGLDLPDLVAAFRPGSGHRKIAERLLRAGSASSNVVMSGEVPNLVDAIEYGAARTWGLALAADIAQYKAGTRSWQDLPRGIVLSGAPGVGKTLFSRSLAAACGVPLFTTSVADLFAQNARGHLDDIIRNFGQFMDRAQNHAPAIALIDEIDSIPNRLTLRGDNSDFWKPFINYVLTRLDNSSRENRKGIIVIGATNDSRDLDPALIRPGRLERIIEIVAPDVAGTRNILKFHAPELGDDELLDIARMVERSTGAELMMCVREARRIARVAGRPLTAADIKAVVLPDTAMDHEKLRRICVHEAGHAVAALALRAGAVRRCVVAVVGRSGGHTMIEAGDRDIVTRGVIERDVVVLLAGRSAERMTHSEISGGGARDLETCTRLIAAMHASAGLGDTVAFLAPPERAIETMQFDGDLRRRVERDLRELQSVADELIVRYRAAVEAIGAALGERRHLSERAVRELFDANVPSPRNP